MRRFCIQSQGDGVCSDGAQRRISSGAVPLESLNKPDLVVEIQTAILQRLISKNILVVEELRCLNKKTSAIIRQGLLRGLFKKQLLEKQ